MTFPNLELKHSKTSELKNENNNTINNNIILSQATKMMSPVLKDLSEIIPDSPRSASPNNIKEFNEALMAILISYFRNNVVLLNNIVEFSDKIITKIDDLQLLISLLLDVPLVDVAVQVEETAVTDCSGEICERLPPYRKIDDIIIKNKQSFKVSGNQYYIQLQTQFNICLDYALL
jgi:hypothetical protein